MCYSLESMDAVSNNLEDYPLVMVIPERPTGVASFAPWSVTNGDGFGHSAKTHGSG